MKNIKIKGKVINRNYKDLTIIDTDSGEILNENAKGIMISFEVNKMPRVVIEYNVNKLELDIEIEDSKTGEYGE